MMTKTLRDSVLAALFVGGLSGYSTQASAEAATAPTDCSFGMADGVRALCHEMVVPASREEVWRLFATTDGLRSWVAPVAAIDLRVGGIWEASYRLDAHIGDPGNIRNKVLSFLPGRMLSISIDSTPPGFPEPELARSTWTVIELEQLDGNRTRVRVSMFGYGEGAGYDRLFAFFNSGNAATLTALHARVISGPTKWATPSTASGTAKP